MRVVDCHVHSSTGTAGEMLKQMDRTGVARTLLISKKERNSLIQTHRNLIEAQKVFSISPDRIGGLAWVDPRIPGMGNLAQRAVTEMGFSGIKIIPDHYYVCDAALEPFWVALDEVGARVLFHTGILWGNDDGSRFCMPVYMEKLMFYPRIKFVMAHISWPWCEECIAVMGRMKQAAAQGGFDWQSYIDLTPGTPDHIRKQAIANAVSYCGVDRLMFGTDSLSDDLQSQKSLIESDGRIFDELGLSARQKEQIFAGTADAVFPVVK